jgi:hypothetical protein
MAQTALPAPRHVTARRRAFFGLFEADGWSWAIVKALFWFVLIIVLLGYIPDRAYYFTVQKTVDIGLLAWSPVNLCPPENQTLPCPAPGGATLPWQPGAPDVNLPAPRTDGAAGVVGSTFLYAGGSDGAQAVADTYFTKAVAGDNWDHWQAGPALPEARRDAAAVVLGNTLYVIGGYGPDGNPTSTVYGLTVANDGTLGQWATEDKLALPEPRAGSSAVAVSDGVVVLGGTSTADATGATRSVWKSMTDTSGKLQAWKDQSPMFEENVDGYAAHVGDVIFVIGGRNAKGEVVATVQQGHVGGLKATTADPNAIVDPWAVSAQTNLPGPRTNMSGFTANGVLYVQGGSDGVNPRTEALWATPDAGGVIAEWHHLAQTDLGDGIEGAQGMAAGSHAFLVGGNTWHSGITAGAARTNLAPQPPFFQLGILGATVPALKLDGEIGQQIGYLNAATVGAVNFVLLLLVGYAFNHKEQTRALFARLRRRRG